MEVELWKVPLVTFLMVFVLTVLEQEEEVRVGKCLERLKFSHCLTDLGVLTREESPWWF